MDIISEEMKQECFFCRASGFRREAGTLHVMHKTVPRKKISNK
jgi:hypothetical protein